MSRLEDADKMRRSIERGEPQPTFPVGQAMTTNPKQDHKAALARAQKMVAWPKGYNRDNLVLAAAYLDLDCQLKDLRVAAKAVTDWPPDLTAKIKALRAALGEE